MLICNVSLLETLYLIDARGYHGFTFDMIKKQNGDFALAYCASTENLDIYTKEILMTLMPNLNQRGNALIFTKPQEELRRIQLEEYYADNLSIAITLNDDRCISSSGNRDNRIPALKYVNISSNGNVDTRFIDKVRGKIELISMHKPSSTSNITVAYNLNDAGRLGQANSDLSSLANICDLKKLL